eukprot:Sspe_Gene.69037::Locus_40688_Transcript_4_4_Confidence_0.818_Length_1351::g.69037::m.69037
MGSPSKEEIRSVPNPLPRPHAGTTPPLAAGSIHRKVQVRKHTRVGRERGGREVSPEEAEERPSRRTSRVRTADADKTDDAGGKCDGSCGGDARGETGGDGGDDSTRMVRRGSEEEIERNDGKRGERSRRVCGEGHGKCGEPSQPHGSPLKGTRGKEIRFTPKPPISHAGTTPSLAASLINRTPCGVSTNLTRGEKEREEKEREEDGRGRKKERGEKGEEGRERQRRKRKKEGRRRGEERARAEGGEGRGQEKTTKPIEGRSATGSRLSPFPTSDELLMESQGSDGNPQRQATTPERCREGKKRSPEPRLSSSVQAANATSGDL